MESKIHQKCICLLVEAVSEKALTTCLFEVIIVWIDKTVFFAIHCVDLNAFEGLSGRLIWLIDNQICTWAIEDKFGALILCWWY